MPINSFAKKKINFLMGAALVTASFSSSRVEQMLFTRIDPEV
jgi:Na+-transporting methylmalonyl-CoA/oxaloacetate decarboxylase beta subunit